MSGQGDLYHPGNMGRNIKREVVVPGATRITGDNYQQRTDSKGRPEWRMPRHKYIAPHWASEGMRRAAEKMGLDRMTAGIPYVVMVPVYTAIRNDNFRHGARCYKYALRLAARKEFAEKGHTIKMGAPSFPDLGGL